MFWLGTHRPDWLGRTAVPLLVSHRTLGPRKSLPRALGPWVLDSGGFSELSLYGAWRTTPGQYAEAVARYATEIGGLAWAAPMDWMCEPWIVDKTGLSIGEHQRRTVASFLRLRETAPTLPWVPVLQGFALGDYLRCLDLYAAAGVDLRAAPLVGVGSVCRRQGTAEAEGIFARLWQEGLRLHGFGLKTLGLRRFAGFLASSDSMAWSSDGRRQAARLRGGLSSKPCPGGRAHTDRTGCANCLDFALAWRDETLAAIGQAPRQWQLRLAA